MEIVRQILTGTLGPTSSTFRDANVFDIHAHSGFLPPKEPLSRLLPEWELEILPPIVTGTLESASFTVQDANAFDVHPHSGFMPPEEPLARLPRKWELWEDILDAAIQTRLQLGNKVGLSEREKSVSEIWRCTVRQMPLLDTKEMISSPTPIVLRRAHLVLGFVMHFYIHSLPPHAAIIIPRPLALPFLRISAALDIPPILTFSDTVLYNWTSKYPSEKSVHEIDNLRTRTMFSGLVDEEDFYLCSSRIELRGIEALELMRMTMDEILIGDNMAVRRIAGYLRTMAGIINDLKGLLLDVQKKCRPDRYYNEVRPWLKGEDSDVGGRKWTFEGIEEDSSLKLPTELSGPSAGQSSLIHTLDVFLGVDHQSASPGKRSFMQRMQAYMPRNHRLFLDHISSNQRPLRAFVISSNDQALHDAYNLAVLALKELRDSHMIIATLYIIGPARKAARAAAVEQKDGQPVLGTGGTDLVKFLKDTRSRTFATMIP